MSNLLDLVKRSQMRADLPEMHPGDTVRVHARIVEGNKERVQVYEGVIISIRRGQNASTVTVRRISHASIGVERTFMLHSPRIDRFEVVRRGRVRRAKLYYLRSRQGKSARIKELRPTRHAAMRAAAATEAATAAPVAPEAPVAETIETAVPPIEAAAVEPVTEPAVTEPVATEAAAPAVEPVAEATAPTTPAEAQE
jgi:large subunit ribosomal protein L19